MRKTEPLTRRKTYPYKELLCYSYIIHILILILLGELLLYYYYYYFTIGLKGTSMFKRVSLSHLLTVYSADYRELVGLIP